MRDSVWIGMYDEESDANQVVFRLPSGQTPTYTNWATQEPNTAERCVSFVEDDRSLGQLNLGKWTVVPCNYKKGYFCKKPFQPVPTTTPKVQFLGCPPVNRLINRSLYHHSLYV